MMFCLASDDEKQGFQALETGLLMGGNVVFRWVEAWDALGAKMEDADSQRVNFFAEIRVFQGEMEVGGFRSSFDALEIEFILTK